MDASRVLREARERAGLSQAGLASRAGTSQATISAYESGRKEPSVATFTRLLAATGTRLRVDPGHDRVREPSREQLVGAGRGLIEVLALAQALPTRHPQRLDFPRLSTRGR